MAIKLFNFDYDCCEAKVVFKVDTEVFTNQHAQETLDFFTWDYDEDNDPVEEVLRKYAMEVIILSTNRHLNIKDITSHFNTLEGFGKVDGTYGLTLMSVTPFEFEDHKIELLITDF